MSELLATADAVAREAGALLVTKFRTHLDIREKGRSDLVTEADLASEELIMRRLREAYPQYAILTEETGAHGDDTAHRWIIDPLDGTNNFAHGYPRWCVTIAYAEQGVVQCGVVYDPILDEMYSGVRGGGSFVNGAPLAVSTTESLADALCATGFPYDKATSADNNLPLFAAILARAQGVRRDGAAALDLCYVARGIFDGFWELKLKPWDVAAGALIIDEAGGRVSNLTGGPLDLFGDEICASNGRIHDALLAAFPTRARGQDCTQ